MACHGLFDLGFFFAHRIGFSRDVADGNYPGRSIQEGGGAAVEAAGKSSETGIDAFREADFDLEGIVFQGAFHLRAGVPEARGGVQYGVGWKGLGEKHRAALEIRHVGEGAVGIRDFGEVQTCESGIEFGGRFYFWKLDNSEIKLTRKCGKRQE
jgi:hypothetical protein